jgi:hypothetical protein
MVLENSPLSAILSFPPHLYPHLFSIRGELDPATPVSSKVWVSF